MILNPRDILPSILTRYFQNLFEQILNLPNVASVFFSLRGRSPEDFLDWEYVLEHVLYRDTILVSLNITTATNKAFLLLIRFDWKSTETISKKYPGATPCGDVTPYEFIGNYVVTLSQQTGEKCFAVDVEPHHGQFSTFPFHCHKYPKELDRLLDTIETFDGTFASLIKLLSFYLKS